MKKRLAVYHAQTEPLIAYYARWAAIGDRAAPRYRRVEGVGTVEGISEAVLAALPADGVARAGRVALRAEPSVADTDERDATR